jgi:hypothetical protein
MSNRQQIPRSSGFGDFLFAVASVAIVLAGVRFLIHHAAVVFLCAAVALVACFSIWVLQGSEPPVRRPELAGAYRSLVGQDTAHDSVLTNLGLFIRSGGQTHRPTDLHVFEGNYFDLLRFRPIPGTATRWLQDIIEKELCHLWGHPYVIDSRTPGRIDICFQHTPVPSPVDRLAAPVVLGQVNPLSILALRVGVDAEQRWIDVPLANRGGCVVGGETGSGKSASLQGMLAGLMHSPLVQIAVVDGKGGADWDCFRPRAFAHISTTSDLASVRDLLLDIESERIRRVSHMPALRGSRSFWEAGGPTAEMPLIVLVVDESQVFLDADYLRTKDAKECGAEISGLLKSLMAMGRSAGIFTVLATQKPTADSVPTAVRDNAGIRLAYKVNSRAAATAILGDGWSELGAGVSPLNATTGVCVYRGSEGSYLRARSAFIAEPVIAATCRSFTSLAISPCVAERRQIK